MDMDFTRTRLTVPDNVVTRDVDGTTILVDIDTGRSFSLDGTASRAWALLIANENAQAAYEALLKEYAGEPSEIRGDLGALLEILIAKRLLVER